MLEAPIEKAVCDYAKTKGFLVYKFNSANYSSVPDRMFVHKSGVVFFIEFKATGKKPTPSQEREHSRMRGHNVNVFVVDDITNGKKIIDDVEFMGGF